MLDWQFSELMCPRLGRPHADSAVQGTYAVPRTQTLNPKLNPFLEEPIDILDLSWTPKPKTLNRADARHKTGLKSLCGHGCLVNADLSGFRVWGFRV